MRDIPKALRRKFLPRLVHATEVPIAAMTLFGLWRGEFLGAISTFGMWVL